MLSAKISRGFKNSGISSPPIDTSSPSRDPYRSFKSQHRCQNPRIVLPSLVYPYFELDIEQNEIRKALLIK